MNLDSVLHADKMMRPLLFHKLFFFTFSSICLLLNNAAWAQFSGGTGSETDPFQVASIEQLQEINQFKGHHFIQTADIDASVTNNWNDGQGFLPIGNESSPFTGSFDGNSFIIDNLVIHREEEDLVGLFGYTDQAMITAVTLANFDIRGKNKTGALTGFNRGEIHDSGSSGTLNGGSQSGGLVGENRGEIFNSFSTAQVTGINMVGGLAGANYGGKDSGIRNSHATGNVSGDVGVGGLAGWSYGVMMNNYATGHVSGEERSGGLVGESYADTYNSYATGNVSAPGIKVGALVGENYGEILNTYAHGNVLGGSEVGGLVGCNYGIVRESFSTGNVNGSERIGGLAGESYGEVSNSYARGRVNGSSMVGGLVGNNSKFGITDGGDIFNTYAAGRVAGNNSVGGLIGNNIASIRSSYWDLESTEQFHGIGTSESGSFDEIEGLNTSEMTGTAAEEHMPSFPFYEKWITETDDYPRLLWELPYFMIRITEADNPVYRGNSNVITAMVTNIGGVEDSQTIELVNDAGQILDIHEDLTLAGGDSLEIVLSWTPGEDDPLSEYKLIVRTLNRSETVNTRLEEHPDNIPSALTLSQNFPNPFNSSTVISYGLPETSHVRLEVFDLLGRRVRLLLNDEISAGRHRVLFDAGGLPSGMYLYRLSAGNTLQSRTLHYIK